MFLWCNSSMTGQTHAEMITTAEADTWTPAVGRGVVAVVVVVVVVVVKLVSDSVSFVSDDMYYKLRSKTYVVFFIAEEILFTGRFSQIRFVFFCKVS